MKIQLKEKLHALTGEVLKIDNEDLTVGMALANILISAREGGKMKMFVLAQRCFTENVIEVDTSDLTLVKRTVETTEMFNNLVNGQLLVLLETPVENSKKE